MLIDDRSITIRNRNRRKFRINFELSMKENYCTREKKKKLFLIYSEVRKIKWIKM